MKRDESGEIESVHVVVEYGVLVVVELEQSLSVGHAKIFKVKQRLREVFPHELDESDSGIIRLEGCSMKIL